MLCCRRREVYQNQTSPRNKNVDKDDSFEDGSNYDHDSDFDDEFSVRFLIVHLQFLHGCWLQLCNTLTILT